MHDSNVADFHMMLSLAIVVFVLLSCALAGFGAGYACGKRATYRSETGTEYMKEFKVVNGQGTSRMWTNEDQGKLDASIRAWADNGDICRVFSHAWNLVRDENENVEICALCGFIRRWDPLKSEYSLFKRTGSLVEERTEKGPQ